MSKTESRFVDFRAVKAAVTIEQVLSHYGVLDRFKRGRDSLSGPCPIHQGTNPTQFRVSISKNCWNCFSDCKCGGNVLDLVVRMENVGPMEAANCLVDWFHLDRAGLNAEHDGKKVEQNEKPAPPEKPTVKSEEAPAAKPAAKKKRPSKSTADESGPNKPLAFELELDPAHPYLTERGLTAETIKEFGFGYCAKGVMAQRIAIPIHNVTGELVGYAGRWPGEPPDGRPKYRLPDGFRKGSEVYRLGQAIREPSDLPLVIVEGFFDVIKLWQLGVRRCVALMGSSMSIAQETLLGQHIAPDSKVIVMFDQDDAGQLGREWVLQRLSLRAFVHVVSFAEAGFQPEELTAEQARTLRLL